MSSTFCGSVTGAAAHSETARGKPQKRRAMKKKELKRILKSVGIAGLVAGGGIALTAQPAMSA